MYAVRWPTISTTLQKNHPELVAKLAKSWMQGANKDRQRLVRRACRTLIKNGHPPTLGALGYAPIKLSQTEFEVLTPEVKFGTAVEFSYKLTPENNGAHPYILDFAIHFKKSERRPVPESL